MKIIFENHLGEICFTLKYIKFKYYLRCLVDIKCPN